MKKSIAAREYDNILQTYKRLPIAVDHAEGCRIYDTGGNEYLDFLGGIAVNALGHSHPKIISAVKAQIDKYMHVSNYFYQEPQIELAEALKNISGYGKVFFTNSGAESIEGTLKLVRRWGNKRKKNTILSFTGGFHGRTMGALSLMDKPHYKADMGPFLSGIKVLPYNDTDALKKNITDETAAIVIEFIQGEGGISSASEEFIKTIFELIEKYNFIVVADEIQSGVGRTGKFFSFEHFNVKPDVVTVAKGIGGGLPLGAILTLDHLSDIFESGMHGTTYGGNPVACAAGKVVIDELANGVMENAENIGQYLEYELQKLLLKFPSLISEIRGKGLMRGLLMTFDAGEIVADLIKRKVLSNAASGTVLRMVPPLIINKQDVDLFIERLDKCLKEKIS
ncbi:MAG: aspartate aminotransferase family protein [Candidatus Kapabacteria bacterium]|jgi:acetylornithine/N-succinyldiaminopimelate aminotransferase|nr:aspartate aminotransferase family protein [Candidatus Kapabacteria bacterium]